MLTCENVYTGRIASRAWRRVRYGQAHILKSQRPAIFTIESHCMLTIENLYTGRIATSTYLNILKSQCPAIFTIESHCMLTFENVYTGCIAIRVWHRVCVCMCVCVYVHTHTDIHTQAKPPWQDALYADL